MVSLMNGTYVSTLLGHINNLSMKTSTISTQNTSTLVPLTSDQANDYFDYIDCGLINLSGYQKDDSEPEVPAISG